MNRARTKVKTFDPKIDGIALAASILGPLVLYVLTMPRTVVLEDDGLFLMAGANLGVAHPPGYPVYTLIVYLFTQLGFGSAAFLGHLSSAVIGSFACGCLYLCARQMGASSIPALTASWLFASSEHFWSQAIITEVYTLNALFFFGLYFLILRGTRHPGNACMWIAAAVIYGLSLANHWPLMILSTPGLILLVCPVWKTVCRKTPTLLGALFISAILPYLWMVWRSLQNPPVSFYGPIGSFEKLWFFVSRKGYADADVSPSADWADRFGFMEWLGTELVWQLTLPGFVLAMLGIVILLRRRQFLQLGSGLLVLFGNSILLISLIGYDYEYFRIAIFRPYSLLCYGILALLTGAGIQYVLEQLTKRPVYGKTRIPFPASFVVTFLGLAMVVWSVHGHWRMNYRAKDDFTERYVDMLFDFLPKNSTLFVKGDDAFPIGYFKYVEYRRPDIELYAVDGLVYGQRLYDPFLSESQKQETLAEYIESTDRDLFTIGVTGESLIPRSGYYGFLREIVKDSKTHSIQLNGHAGGEVFFTQLITHQPIDRWERFTRNRWLHRYGRYLGVVYFSNNPLYLNTMQKLFKLAESNYACLIGMASSLLQYGNKPEHWDQAATWLSTAETLKHEALSKSYLAILYFQKGRLLQRQGRNVEALAFFRQSRFIYPHPDNPAVISLGKQ